MKEFNQHMELPKRVLTIAGSASGGSAGIQADLKTFHEIGVYGMSVITAIVGRHPETGTNVHPNTITSIEAQFATVLEQTGIDSLKTGMLFSKEIIQVVADLLNEVKNAAIVVDPVMVGKHNSILLREDAMDALVNKIVPQATIITPNMEEASILLDNRPIKTLDDCKQAAIDLHRDGQKQVLVKGGRLKGPAVDILYDGNSMYCLEAPRIPTQNTSGAGCSYSAAIAAYTAKGLSIFDAVKAAKQFITTAIAYSYSFTDKPGPVNQLANRYEQAIYEVTTYKD